MTRLTTLTATIVAISACLAWVPVHAEETAPAQNEQAQQATQLPEGHPQLPEGHPQLPQGHPAMSADQMQQMKRFHGGQLPAGHPALSAEPAEPVVYETTDVEPDWTVAMRHLIVRPMDDQLFITEVWAINNPTDKQYIGAAVAESAEAAGEAKPVETKPDEAAPPAMLDQAGGEAADQMQDSGRVTLVLPLPANASHVQPGTGFHACCVKVEEGKIISTMPMDPGTTQMRVTYLIAPKDGVFDLTLASPKATGQLMVFMPDDDTPVTARGLSAGDTFKAGDKSFRMFTGKHIEAGADVGLTIQAKQAPAEAASAAPGAGEAVIPVDDSAGQIKLVAGLGVGLLVFAAIFVLLMPAKKQAAASVAN